MPRLIRPEPPPPMSVAIATRVFGSEVLVALIRCYLQQPRSQSEAARALDLPPPLVSTNTRVLIDAGIVGLTTGRVLDSQGRGRPGRRCVVDERRVDELLASLRAYLKDDPADQ